MTTYFITRHKGALEWAARQGGAAMMLSHLDPLTIQAGDTVIGTLPVHIAAQICARGGRYQHLTLDIPPNLRGRELSADQMEALGAKLEEYTICKLS